jgi:hypothetical protein
LSFIVCDFSALFIQDQLLSFRACDVGRLADAAKRRLPLDQVAKINWIIGSGKTIFVSIDL